MFRLHFAYMSPYQVLEYHMGFLQAFGAQKKCLKRSTDEQRTRATTPERRREVAVTHIPERSSQSDMERSLALLS